MVPRHGDVVQPTYAPRRVYAHRDKKAAPGLRNFIERGVHMNLVIAVISRRNKPLGGIRADDERGAREQARLFHEGRCP